ncbi:hypothetical protein L1887_20484 [Cichorium endivia]|nr:hypothetical protein L1887_20484 [Cichorium endivia]
MYITEIRWFECTTSTTVGTRADCKGWQMVGMFFLSSTGIDFAGDRGFDGSGGFFSTEFTFRSVNVCEPVVFGVELDEDTGDSAVFDGMKTPEILQMVSHEYKNGLTIESSWISTKDYSTQLLVPEALEFVNKFEGGIDGIMKWNHQHVIEMADIV